MKKLYVLLLVVLSATTISRAQNVGIGTNNPGEKLDVDGNVKFRGGELSTDNIADIVPFYVRGTGVNNNSNRVYVIGSTVIYNSAARGLQLTIINKSDYSVVSNTNYDTYGSTTASDALATAINGLTSGQIGVITSYDAWEAAVTTNLDNAFRAHGLIKAFAANNDGGTHRKPYAAMFEGGSGVNTAKAVEVLVPSNSTAPYAEIRGWFISGSFVAAPTLPNALMNVEGSNVGLYVDEASNVNANSNRITNVAAPTTGGDATNKTYVDGLINNVTNSDDWDLSGISLYPKSTTYNLGLGNTNPGAYRLNVSGNTFMSGNLLVSQGNATGGGITLADDGDIVDNNDGYATHRFSYGLRLTNANAGGTTVIQLSNGVAGSGNTYFNAPNNFGIGNNNPLAKFHVSGTSRFDGNMNVASGTVTVNGLAGAGNRPVYANASGTLVSSGSDNQLWTMAMSFASSPDDLVGGDVLSDVDDGVANYNLPFTYSIEGVGYSNITISSNGWVAFGTVGGSFNAPTTLPSGNFSTPVIFPYWTDLKDFGSGEYVRAYTYGSSPNRVVIVHHRSKGYCSNNSGPGGGDRLIEYQVQIHENGGINVKYITAPPTMNGQQMVCGGTYNVAIGFQLSGGSGAKAFPISYNAKVLDDNRQGTESWSVSPVK